MDNEDDMTIGVAIVTTVFFPFDLVLDGQDARCMADRARELELNPRLHLGHTFKESKRAPSCVHCVKEASKVYGVTTLEHPAVQMISMERGKYYLGGKLQVRDLYGCYRCQLQVCALFGAAASCRCDTSTCPWIVCDLRGVIGQVVCDLRNGWCILHGVWMVHGCLAISTFSMDISHHPCTQSMTRVLAKQLFQGGCQPAARRICADHASRHAAKHA
eukprot:543413-Pelagomonas_calceolata.AAC.6